MRVRSTLTLLLPRLILVALGVGASVLLLEVVLRVTPPIGDGYRPTKIEPHRRHRAQSPDFRQRRFDTDKPPGTFRLLVIGDSFTWGAGVLQEDAYPDRIETNLRIRRTEPPIEVINWSRPGWNTVREWTYTRGHLNGLDPDMLILGYCLNDAEPMSKRRLEALRTRRERRSPGTPLATWLHRHSRAYHLVYEKLEDMRQRRALDAYYQSLYGPRGGWSANRAALAKFQRWAQRRSVPMLLVIFPIFTTQIDDGYPHRDLHALVAEAATSLGIEVLDLMPAYEGIDARRLALVAFTDGHPSEIAHRIAAQEVIRRLEEEGWLPQETPQPKNRRR